MGDYAKLPSEETDGTSQSRRRTRKSRLPNDDFNELTPAASEVKVPIAIARATESAGEIADRVADRVEANVTRAALALQPPESADVGALVKETDLPALQGADTVSELAVRLDREADLWRNLAMREFSRQSWMSKVTQGVAIGVLVVDVGLAIMAGVSALFGGSAAASRSLLFGVAGFLVTAGAIVVAMVAASSAKVERDVARSALARADLAELRLHRLGIALAWRETTPELYQEALVRLERDM